MVNVRPLQTTLDALDPLDDLGLEHTFDHPGDGPHSGPYESPHR